MPLSGKRRVLPFVYCRLCTAVRVLRLMAFTASLRHGAVRTGLDPDAFEAIGVGKAECALILEWLQRGAHKVRAAPRAQQSTVTAKRQREADDEAVSSGDEARGGGGARPARKRKRTRPSAETEGESESESGSDADGDGNGARRRAVARRSHDGTHAVDPAETEDEDEEADEAGEGAIGTSPAPVESGDTRRGVVWAKWGSMYWPAAYLDAT